MSSKDKDNTLNKLKDFFKKSKLGSVKERELWPELEKELRPETPVTQRCKILKDLGELVLQSKLEDAAISKLIDLTKDLIVDNKPTEYRQTTLTFYKKLIEGQYANLKIVREHFFLLIQKHNVAEDLKHRLDLLIVLTENGKDITNFEEKIGKFMLQWAPSMVQSNLTEPYLEMLVNIIKFNAAHLDNEIIIGIVQYACTLCCDTENSEIGLACLKVLDAVICYTIFPNETLALCVSTLCRTVNNEPYCQTSWKNMKMLLGTKLGYASLLIMCNILNDKMFYGDAYLLRGAIFHTNMGVFSSSSAIQMTYNSATISAILISFLRALESKHIIVTYEVILSIQILIPKFGKELSEHIWDIICDLLSTIAKNIFDYEIEGLAKNLNLQKKFHETVDKVEEMLKKNEICINPDLFYDLIQKIAETRSEVSVLNLIEFRSSKVTAARPEWLQVLHDFIQRFYKISNTDIRVKTVQALIKIMDMNRAGYEEEILERVIIPEFSSIANENDVQVRNSVCKALIEFSRHCDTKRCGELLDILEKILNRPFDIYRSEAYCYKSDLEFQDVSAAVDGLIDVFLVKLYKLPSCHAIKIFNMLVEHLEFHYQMPMVFEKFNNVRYKIFNWMLKARANAAYQIGYPDPFNNNQMKFSHYLGIDSSLPLHGVSYQQQISTQSNPDTIPLVNLTKISIRRACKLIVICIEKEKDFSNFQLVLKELPNILQNKAIILGNDIESLANVLFLAYTTRKDRKFLPPTKTTSDELNTLILPAIASLVIYHQFLQPNKHINIIVALQSGFNQRIANICINTLTIMILEMPEALMRKLGSMLLEMSKMTDTPHVAMPVLEFLSILSRLPNHLFSNFVPKEYMYVFAISFPYTKPQRYDHYTVSLAHHVIAGWFLKCKLTFRRNFVNYIISSIQTNSKHFEDNKYNSNRTDFSLLNEDSSNRKRSTSLTERGSKSRGENTSTDLRPRINESLKTFHVELAETCIDFLARHTFSPCSALPKRLPAVEQLFKDGPSQTWLVGQNLITITTSGCSSPPTRNGLCERCGQLEKSNSQNRLETIGTATGYGGQNSPEINQHNKVDGPDFRRYTKASLQHSSGTDSTTSADLTTSSSISQQQNSIESGSVKRHVSNSSSGSLEGLSRRGSNPDSSEIRGESFSGSLNAINQFQFNVQQRICARSCTGWAEIFVRRPTGNISWIMRIQNPISNDCLGNDLPFNDLINLFLPTQYGGVFGPDLIDDKEIKTQLETEDQKELIEVQKNKHLKSESDKAGAKSRSLKRQEEITSGSAVGSSGPINIPKKAAQKESAGSFSDIDQDDDDDENKEGSSDDGDIVRSRNPVRRVNSSPEMSSSWRNPFMQSKTNSKSESSGGVESVEKEEDQQQKKKSYSKDMRVSCEAIPEEIAGSTPPSQSETSEIGSNEKKEPDPSIVEDTSKLQVEKGSQLPPKQHSADDVTNQMQNLSVSGSTASLKIPLEKIVSKPPQSPVPLSPRLLAKNAANKIASFAPNVQGGNSDNGDMPRGRAKTISVVREVNRNTIKNNTNFSSRFRGSQPTGNSRLGVNPSFIFMQLFHTGQLQCTEMPLKVSVENMKAVELLDLIPPFETHKISILYVGPGQCNNKLEMLKNRYGSTRYMEFLRNIGILVNLKDAKENNLFVNMESNGRDGKFTYVWKDDIVHVTFHVATLMPNLENDPICMEKIKHIGNNFVSIIYNESGEEYNLNTIQGQFNYVCVVVQPLELNTNRIYVKAKSEIEKFVCHPELKIVSDRSAPLLARQLALHANLASHVYQSLKTKNPYASNWLERLRKIKKLRNKILKESENINDNSDTTSNQATTTGSGSLVAQRPNIHDFTKYT